MLGSLPVRIALPIEAVSSPQQRRRAKQQGEAGCDACYHRRLCGSRAHREDVGRERQQEAQDQSRAHDHQAPVSTVSVGGGRSSSAQPSTETSASANNIHRHRIA